MEEKLFYCECDKMLVGVAQSVWRISTLAMFKIWLDMALSCMI